ncbi:uncharacterized protein Rel [Epargyreus clarus]|uniref:uncharacterized protein Rel n=1 Tax=Epargyreus clarus TaxID=520877 RepID=UPI003C2DEE50
MSSSDQDMSDTSNMESPYSQITESPYSSPSQQVPQLANFMDVLTCKETQHRRGKSGPYLRIVEQPQDHFRFRYRSEMIGTHGCLLGRSTNSSKTKTHPTVELMNYAGKALIRCVLAQHNNTHEHPHKLLEDDQDRDVSKEVPGNGSYMVGFGGMGIIHTAKKDVATLLFKKYTAQGVTMDDKDLRLHCENITRNINLNIVRLKFSAHDLATDAEICPPVFSEPIHNMKSAATNDLKICRISRISGGPRGGDDVFVLVEKVNKKNIIIRFYELDPSGEEVWTANGVFLQSDVHHQYAIVFRTPKYKDLQIASDVKVFVELVRPSDGRTSEPREFTYKADPVYRQNKKRKANSSYSSINSSSGGSLNSMELPTAVQAVNNQHTISNLDALNAEQMVDLNAYANNIPRIPQAFVASDNPMANALMHDVSGAVSLSPAPLSAPLAAPLAAPLSAPLAAPLAQHYSSVGPPELQLNSTELDNIVNGSIPPEERSRFHEMFNNDYMRPFNDSFPLIGMTMLTSDSGRAKDSKRPLSSEASSPSAMMIDDEVPLKGNKNSEYTAYYTSEDGIEVKKLVKELCEIIRNKSGYKKQVVREKLERLFEMRLSNGDTFLHMTLCSNQPSLEFIVKLIHNMRMTHLLNLRNHRMKTILHLAVENDLPKLVTFLVSKGCDPMAEDNDGNNAVHYAVIYQTCLVPLLDAIRDNNVSFDINAYNNEKQTALHLAAVHWSERGARALLARGAARGARDAAARTALHLAAYDGALPAARALAHHLPPGEIDAIDGQGNTALQIVCGGEQKEHSLEIMKLLLDNKADPMKHEEFNKPAWKLCTDKPEMFELMQKYVSFKTLREDNLEIKSEPEDEYESADDGEGYEEAGVLRQCARAVSRALDASGGWRALARRLPRAPPPHRLAAAASPARDLLDHLQVTDPAPPPPAARAAAAPPRRRRQPRARPARPPAGNRPRSPAACRARRRRTASPPPPAPRATCSTTCSPARDLLDHLQVTDPAPPPPAARAAAAPPRRRRQPRARPARPPAGNRPRSPAACRARRRRTASPPPPAPRATCSTTCSPARDLLDHLQVTDPAPPPPAARAAAAPPRRRRQPRARPARPPAGNRPRSPAACRARRRRTASPPPPAPRATCSTTCSPARDLLDHLQVTDPAPPPPAARAAAAPPRRRRQPRARPARPPAGNRPRSPAACRARRRRTASPPPPAPRATCSTTCRNMMNI